MSLPMPNANFVPGGNALQALNGIVGSQNALMNRDLQAEYAPQMAQGNLDKLNLQNQYLPFGYDIRAQNALNSSLKNNPYAQYLRSISTLPPPLRTQYMANPQNYATFTNAQNQVAQLMNNRPSVNSLFPNMPGAQWNGPAPASSAGMGSSFSGPPPMPSGMPNQPSPYTVSPQDAANLPSSIVGNSGGGVPSSLPTNIGVNINRTPEERDQDVRTLAANNQLVTDKNILRRANGAVGLESWLRDNQADYSKRLRNAAQYSNLTGAVKKGIDSLNPNPPEGYTDYQWATTQFAPDVANQIKVMEGLSGTDKQRQELHKMIDYVSQLQSSPKLAIKNINNSIRTLGELSDSVFNAAEPLQKGIYRRNANVPKLEGDYIPMDSGNAPAGMASILDASGKPHFVPEKNVKALLSDPSYKGWRRQDG